MRVCFVYMCVCVCECVRVMHTFRVGVCIYVHVYITTCIPLGNLCGCVYLCTCIHHHMHTTRQFLQLTFLDED